MVPELTKATERIAAGKPEEVIQQLTPTCSCFFFRKYFLPCRHMFQLYMSLTDGWLNDAIWEIFVDASGECVLNHISLEKRT